MTNSETCFGIDIDKYKIISFDIFDTLITRSVAHPFGVFYLLQRKLMQNQKLKRDFTNKFVHIRIDAERKAQRRFKKEQADFEQIYQVICDDNGYSQSDRAYLMDLEFQTELSVIRPIQEMVHFLDEVRKKNIKVIFLTDTYLNRQYIEKILNHVNLYHSGETIYSSSDMNMTKATGRLFRHVLKMEKCDHHGIIHIGNNYRIDILPAQKNGFDSYYYNVTDINRYESALAYGTSTNITSSFFQSIAGASRMARLQMPYHNNIEEKTYSYLGANVAGPILYAYVAWILTKAKEKKLKRLYFIARDGEILLEIARRIYGYFYSEVELRYIYGSRQSWHLPSVTSIGECELDWLFDLQPFLTLQAFAKRLNIDAEIVHLLFDKYSGLTVDLDQPLSENALAVLREITLSSE